MRLMRLTCCGLSFSFCSLSSFFFCINLASCFEDSVSGGPSTFGSGFGFASALGSLPSTGDLTGLKATGFGSGAFFVIVGSPYLCTST